MYKRLLAFFLVFMMISALPVSASKFYYDDFWRTHDETVLLNIDGKEVVCDVPPIIVDGRTLVPARAFFERMGAEVSWNEKQKKVTIQNADFLVTLTIDSTSVSVNDKIITLDVPAKIITDEAGNGRTMIPLRFISESMGYEVIWHQETRTVDVNNSKQFYISNISSSEKTGEDIISVALSSLPEIKKMTLDNPSRLVFDFYDTVLNLKHFEAQDGICFSNIRFSDHDDYARVVLDLTKKCSYRTNTDNNSFVIYLTPEPNEGGGDEIQAPPDKTDTVEDGEQPKEPDNNKPAPTGGTGLVVIDAGHGGSDPGAIGYEIIEKEENGEITEEKKATLLESEANLGIALKIYDILKSRGVEVVLTRSADVYVGLTERAEIANKLNASIFVSVHNNSATIASANGTGVYYYNSGEDTSVEDAYGISSKQLSQIVLKHIIESGRRYNRGISDGSKLVVLNSSVMPAILLECAFLSNDEERELLKTDAFRQAIADGAAEGIIEALTLMGKAGQTE